MWSTQPVKLIETESKTVATMGWNQEGGMGNYCLVNRGQDDEKIRGMDSDDCCTQNVNITNAIVLYTQK